MLEITTTGKQVVVSAEVYDPAIGRFMPTGALLTARHKHAAALLQGGNVLIVGGTTGNNDSTLLTSTELYDPQSGAFRPGPPLLSPRDKFGAVAPPSGSELGRAARPTSPRSSTPARAGSWT